jgi:hypothetical protein
MTNQQLQQRNLQKVLNSIEVAISIAKKNGIPEERLQRLIKSDFTKYTMMSATDDLLNILNLIEDDYI